MSGSNQTPCQNRAVPQTQTRNPSIRSTDKLSTKPSVNLKGKTCMEDVDNLRVFFNWQKGNLIGILCQKCTVRVYLEEAQSQIVSCNTSCLNILKDPLTSMRTLRNYQQQCASANPASSLGGKRRWYLTTALKITDALAERTALDDQPLLKVLPTM